MSKQGGGESIRGRVFEIMQYEYNPKTGYKKDGTPKKNAKPLITEQQIRDGLNHKTIKRWAYAWHDKDIYLEADEQSDPWKVAGKPKHRHAHIALEAPSTVTIEMLARWFGVPENYIERKSGRGAFIDCVEYLVHESPRAVEQGKYHYDDDAVVANFDWRTEVNEMQKNRELYGSSNRHMTKVEEMKLRVLRDGWSMAKCDEVDPVTFCKCRNSLGALRSDYLRRHAVLPQVRINYYIDGEGGIGKSIMSRMLARALFPYLKDTECYFEAGHGGKSLQNYDGQPVIIFDDRRAFDFIQEFGDRGAVFDLLNLTPSRATYDVKYGEVTLANSVTIINGIQGYAEFLDGLAGQYKDRNGTTHKVEDKSQAQRRFPFIIPIYENSFSVLINKGVFEGTREFGQYLAYEGLRVCVGDMKRKLDEYSSESRRLQREVVSLPVSKHHELEEFLKPKDDIDMSDFVGWGKPIDPNAKPKLIDLDNHTETVLEDMEYPSVPDVIDIQPEGNDVPIGTVK